MSALARPRRLTPVDAWAIDRAMADLNGCADCVAYLRRRGPLITAAIRRYAVANNEPPARVARRAARNLHARHLAGAPLDHRSHR